MTKRRCSIRTDRQGGGSTAISGNAPVRCRGGTNGGRKRPDGAVSVNCFRVPVGARVPGPTLRWPRSWPPAASPLATWVALRHAADARHGPAGSPVRTVCHVRGGTQASARRHADPRGLTLARRSPYSGKNSASRTPAWLRLRPPAAALSTHGAHRHPGTAGGARLDTGSDGQAADARQRPARRPTRTRCHVRGRTQAPARGHPATRGLTIRMSAQSFRAAVAVRPRHEILMRKNVVSPS